MRSIFGMLFDIWDYLNFVVYGPIFVKKKLISGVGSEANRYYLMKALLPRYAASVMPATQR